jgi:hypothetical protein
MRIISFIEDDAIEDSETLWDLEGAGIPPAAGREAAASGRGVYARLRIVVTSFPNVRW